MSADTKGTTVGAEVRQSDRQINRQTDREDGWRYRLALRMQEKGEEEREIRR